MIANSFCGKPNYFVVQRAILVLFVTQIHKDIGRRSFEYNALSFLEQHTVHFKVNHLFFHLFRPNLLSVLVSDIISDCINLIGYFLKIAKAFCCS